MTGPNAGRRVDAEEVIMALAARQHGVVARAQLIEAGVSPDVVDRRLKSRRLRALQRGVYLVPALRSRHAREMAAALACGESAVVGHRSVATLWQLLPERGRAALVDIMVARGNPRRAGVRSHRVRTLMPDEVTRLAGIPVTTPARTLLDLASVVSRRELERALARALARGLTSRSQILALLDRYPRRSGTRRLRAALASRTEPALTRSEAEEHFLALIRRTQLPRPEANVEIEGYEVDFLWRAERLVVEIDGFAFHSSAEMFESDRRRDAALAAAGLTVMRVTWRQLVSEPEAVLVRLAQALARASQR